MPQSKRHPARRPQQRSPKVNHRNPAAAPKPARPPATGARASLERASVRPLLVLHSLPSWLVPAALAVLLLAGLALPWAWTGVLLLVPAAFLGWLLALSWPVTSVTGRAMRVLVVLALVAAGVSRLAGRF